VLDDFGDRLGCAWRETDADATAEITDTISTMSSIASTAYVSLTRRVGPEWRNLLDGGNEATTFAPRPRALNRPVLPPSGHWPRLSAEDCHLPCGLPRATAPTCNR